MVYIQNNAFIIRNHRANQLFVHFLESIPGGNGFENIRELQFSSFHPFRDGEESADLQLVKQCSGLRRLKLTFYVEKFRRLLNPPLHTSKVLLEVVKHHHYQLSDLFDCKKLDHVSLDGISAWCSWEDLVPAMSYWQVTDELAECMRRGFAERKMHVTVDATWTQW